MRKVIFTSLLAAVLSLNLLMPTAVLAENKKTFEVSADVLEYNAATGMVDAQGQVIIKQQDATITGYKAAYNTKTQETRISGAVKVVQSDIILTSDEVKSYNNNHIVAAGGDVVLTKGDNQLKASQLEYFIEKEYAVTSGGWGQMSMPDGVMNAGRIEAFFAEKKVIARDNVHIVSDTKNLDATSDHAAYYGGEDGKQGKIVLTGNARALQDGNLLTGNTLTLYLNDKAADVQGRAKLVIKPGE